MYYRRLKQTINKTRASTPGSTYAISVTWTKQIQEKARVNTKRSNVTLIVPTASSMRVPFWMLLPCMTEPNTRAIFCGTMTPDLPCGRPELA